MPGIAYLMKTVVDPLLPVRQTYSFAVNVEKVGLKRRTFSSGVVPEDIVVNCTRAYLYALGMRKLYDREDTPQRIRMDLTRVGIIP